MAVNIIQKKQGFIKKFFSSISYKEKKETKQFYIPTVGELENYPNKNKQNTNNTQNKNTKEVNQNKQNTNSNQNSQNEEDSQNIQDKQDAQNSKNNQNDQGNQGVQDNLNNKNTQEKPNNQGKHKRHNIKFMDNNYNKQQISTSQNKQSSQNIPEHEQIKIRNAKNNKSTSENKNNNKPQQATDKTISTDIQQNIQYIKTTFNSPTNIDIVIREFIIAEKYKAFIAYLDGMTDKVIINNFILHPLLTSTKLEPKQKQQQNNKQKDQKNDDQNRNENNQENNQESSDKSTQKSNCELDYILQNVLEINQIKKITNPNDAIYEILSGNCLLYIDGCDYYVGNEVKKIPSRTVDKPQTEATITGPQEGFNENLRTNISLIRKNIRNPNLITEIMQIGDRNRSQCAILYLNGLTNPAIIDEVKRRIASIDADLVMGDGMLEQLIEDNSFSIIPTVLVTERPDRTISHIMEGRVAILADGTPFAKIVPITATALIHSPEDAFMRFPYGAFLRIIRIIALIIAVFLPSLYVALTNFHQEMIPTDLLIAIVKAKENVPFPTIVEILLMEFSFELIREAGIRIPGIVGSTLGIIGALVLGQAAVAANIVSPILIIIVAVTGLGSFAVPNFSLALSVRLIRFVFIIIAAWLGFYGITCLTMLVGIYLVSQKSFGVPIFSPISPRAAKSKDAILRYPIWNQERRPDVINPLDIRRQGEVSRKWTQEVPNYSYDKEGKNDKGG